MNLNKKLQNYIISSKNINEDISNTNTNNRLLVIKI